MKVKRSITEAGKQVINQKDIHNKILLEYPHVNFVLYFNVLLLPERCSNADLKYRDAIVNYFFRQFA